MGLELCPELHGKIAAGDAVGFELAEFECVDIVEEPTLLNGFIGDPNGEEYAAGRGERVLGIACPFRFIDFEGDGGEDGAGEIVEIGVAGVLIAGVRFARVRFAGLLFVGVLIAAFGDGGLESAKIKMSVHGGLLER